MLTSWEEERPAPAGHTACKPLQQKKQIDQNLFMNKSETEFTHVYLTKKSEWAVMKSYSVEGKSGEKAKPWAPFFAALQTFNHAAPLAKSPSIPYGSSGAVGLRSLRKPACAFTVPAVYLSCCTVAITGQSPKQILITWTPVTGNTYTLLQNTAGSTA